MRLIPWHMRLLPGRITMTTPIKHLPVTTLDELDALDVDEMTLGHHSACRGDIEPGGNSTRAFHHGWRMRMMDLMEIPIPPEHRELVHQWTVRNRALNAKGLS